MIFEELLSEEFEYKYFPLDLTDSLYSKLSRDRLVIELRGSLKSGIITWDELRKFVDKIAEKIQPGYRLDNETALCAIAVAIEELPSQFTCEFLDVFSKSRAVEISKASHMARKCIEYFKEIHES